MNIREILEAISNPMEIAGKFSIFFIKWIKRNLLNKKSKTKELKNKKEHFRY
tara:strand:+ start:96 stop:251 length:156 start_codon:yes stop_codon:yes gene_type:complete